MEKIKDSATSRATSITNKDIASKTHEGLERALAARQGMAKLSGEQVNDVGGGFAMGSEFALCLSIAGGPFYNDFALAIDNRALETIDISIGEGNALIQGM